MKIKYLIGFVVISLALIGSAAEAQSIQYPVKELGNCEDKTACKSYCDKSENTEACVNFAEKNNLMSKEEVGVAKKFIATGNKGPGGCSGKDECSNFCNDIANIDQCVAYAEKNDLMSSKDLEEAKMVQAAIKKGIKPPACKNKSECNTYCEDPNHMEECINFGVEAGFIQGKELEDSQKMLAAIKKGVKPLPCKGKDACDAYCSSSDNIEACMTFAKAVGFMTPEEEQNSDKVIAAIKKGVKPPNCRGKECDAYCAEDAHVEECINFSVAAGFMNEKEAEMAKKTKGKGPGNCKGKEECEAFCNDPDNQETCFNFGKENGMISEEDLKRMEEGRQKVQEAFQQAPPAVLECLNSQVGAGLMEKFKSGAAMPPKDIGDKMRGCFEKLDPSDPGSHGKPGAGGAIPPAGQPGPDQKFQPGPGVENPGGQMMPQQAGPGGCKGPEECKVYCESNPEECQKFQPSPNAENPGDQQMPQQNQQGQPNQPGQMQPQENREGMMQPQINQQPPSTGPGSGGGMTPGEFVPMQPQIEQTAPASEGPAPAPEPQTLLKYSPFGAILNFFLGQ